MVIRLGGMRGIEAVVGKVQPRIDVDCNSAYPLHLQRIDGEGWAHRIMLGHDHSVPRGQPTPEMREQRANYQPDGYSFISRRVLFKINVGLDLIRGIEIWL